MPRLGKKYKILSVDPYLEPYASDIDLRMKRYTEIRKLFLRSSQRLSQIANGYLFYGIHRTQTGWVYREWAPGADEMHFTGEFNGWDRLSHPMQKKEDGVWEIELPGENALWHKCLVKVLVTKNGVTEEHIPLYIRRAVQNKQNATFCGQVWAPDKPFKWTDGAYGKRKLAPLTIYEAHIGMAQEKEGVGTYDEFTQNILPRIKEAGYNAVQLMAIQEHPYYASFGYQVSNFYAASSWYGDPDGLKRLVNTAHSMGLCVLLDLVHSHACINTAEGINHFDGTDTQFFKAGEAGFHKAWGSKLFDYGKHEVIHFLLSNIKFWQDEYHFDGFRFDGVTSMLYHDHGLGVTFDRYDKYFSLNTDIDAVTYLQLANELIHEVNPFAVTVAEDMSGMPGMCLPIRMGGIGFDYRLAMGIPDFWIETLKRKDEDWDMGRMWYELTTRRPQEASVGYAESHDQALVGDKTIMFRMADREMYTNMSRFTPSAVVDRAVALHKMIRFATLTMGCEGYLNFMGNEFGHPEWIDFPREGNGWSYRYARRQWSLAEDTTLKYEYLRNFDRAMLAFARKYRLLSKHEIVSLWIGQEEKTLLFEKGGLLYVFNFHPTDSYDSLFVPAHRTGEGKYRQVFSSDEAEFGGQSRTEADTEHFTMREDGRGVGFRIYSPCRTVLVFKKIDE